MCVRARDMSGLGGACFDNLEPTSLLISAIFVPDNNVLAYCDIYI